MSRSARGAALATLPLVASLACDPRSSRPDGGRDERDAARGDAGALACTRDGAFDALEKATECFLPCDDALDLRAVEVSFEPLLPRVLPGGTVGIVLRLRNVSPRPLPLCLRVESLAPTGWEKVAGLPPPKTDRECEHPKLPFFVKTLDLRDASVDALDVGTTVLCRRTLRVVLPPGRSLSKTVPWTALRLPAAPRPFEDDAGNKYTPKATPAPLARGTYRVVVDVPFARKGTELTLATTVEVSEDAR